MEDSKGRQAAIRPMEILMLDPESRKLSFEPIFDREDFRKAKAEGREPLFKGIALHQHCDIPRLSEDGITIEPSCDYVVVDINQIIQLKVILEGIIILDEKGNEVDE